ncbi:TPA: polyphosphate kinase 1, partial [Neisseria gonorrhoeae]
IREGLEMALADNTHAWLMQPDGGYIRAAPAEGESEADLQNDLWDLLRG